MKKYISIFILTILIFPLILNASSFKKYYVVKVLDSSDKIIVEDRFGDQYLVEYGIGCLSMWRYEGKYIDIDTGGGFLDAIGDRIYLFNSEDDCKVWDVEEIGNNSSGYYGINNFNTYSPSVSEYICPKNSHTSSTDITKCDCDVGYQINSQQDACVPIPPKTDNEICKESFGLNSIWNGEKDENGKPLCVCNSGYEWSIDGKSCIKGLVCGENKIKKDNKCFNPNQACESEFGLNSLSSNQVFDSNGSTMCDCKNGYEWNKGQTLCVIMTTSSSTKEVKEKIVNSSEIKQEKIIIDKTMDIEDNTIQEPAKEVKWWKRVLNWFF